MDSMWLARFFLVVTCLILAKKVSADVIISVEPSAVNTTVGNSITLDVNISGVSDLYAFQFDLMFDPAVLSAQTVTNGLFISSISDGTFIGGSIDNIGGTVDATADSEIGLVPGANGSGTLANFQFTGIGSGSSLITVPASSVILLDSNLNDISFTTTGGTVNASGVTSAAPETDTAWLLLLFLLGLIASHRKTPNGA